MDPDLVIQRLVSGLIFLGAAIVAAALATWLVGVLCRRARLPNGLTLLAQLLTPVALFYGGSLYLDAAGVVSTANVMSKDEQISHGSRIPGSWSRSFWATVQFPTPAGPTQAVLWLGEPAFDALRPGSTLDVRYVSWFPHIARPAAESTRSLVPWRLLARAVVAVAIGLFVWRLLRRRSPALMGLILFAGVAGGVVWWVFPSPWETALEPPVLTTLAEVRSVRLVTRSFVSGRSTGYIEAPQPWNVVELQFVPEGRDQPVVAVDGVDEGSVDDLEPGVKLPVQYNPERPRDARLDGERTYRWREWVELGEYVALVIAAGAGVWLLGKLAGGWWRRVTGRS